MTQSNEAEFQRSVPVSPLDPLTHDEEWMEYVRAAELPLPAAVIGEYDVLQELRGGQGVVYHARQPRLNREVALKRLAHGPLSSAAEQRRSEREVELATSLDHPGIVTVHGVEVLDQRSMLVMEWVDGLPIDEWARARSSNHRTTIRRFIEVCDAVQHALQRGVLHRDLKPSNILVDQNDRVRVLDFGLAKRLYDPNSELSATRTLGFVGTPAYAPPEYFTDGHAPLDARGDVWSLGVVLFELLTGERPFEGSSIRALIEAITTHDPRRASSLSSSVDYELDTILIKALSKSPNDRYPTIHAFAEDLWRYDAGQPILAMRPGVTYVLRKWIARHKVESTLIGLLIASSVAGVALGYRQARQISDERDRVSAALDESDRAREAEVLARRELTKALEATRLEADKSKSLQDYYLNAALRPFADGNARDRENAVRLLYRLADQAPDTFGDRPDVAATVLGRVARALADVDRIAEARTFVEQAIEHYEITGESSDPSLRGKLEDTLANTVLALEGSTAARPILQNAIAYYDAISNPSWEAVSAKVNSMLLLAKLELSTGNTALAQSLFHDARLLLGDEGRPRAPEATITIEIYIAQHEAREGNMDAALERLANVRAFASEQLDVDAAANIEVHNLTTVLARMQGRYLDAAASLHEEIRLWELHLPSQLPQQLQWCVGIARQLRDAGEVEAAMALYAVAPRLNGDPVLTRAAVEERAALEAQRP